MLADVIDANMLSNFSVSSVDFNSQAIQSQASVNQTRSRNSVPAATDHSDLSVNSSSCIQNTTFNDMETTVRKTLHNFMKQGSPSTTAIASLETDLTTAQQLNKDTKFFTSTQFLSHSIDLGSQSDFPRPEADHVPTFTHSHHPALSGLSKYPVYVNNNNDSGSLCYVPLSPSHVSQVQAPVLDFSDDELEYLEEQRSHSSD